MKLTDLKNSFQGPFYFKLACVAIAILSFGYLANIGQTILVPLILGSLFALLLLPVAHFFEYKLRLPRSIASFVTTVLFFASIIGLLGLLGAQLTVLRNDWPAFQDQLTAALTTIQHLLSDYLGMDPNEQMSIINDTAKSSVNAGTAIVGVALMSLSSVVIFFVFTFLYTFFVLIYRRHLVKFLLLIYPTEHHARVMDIVTEVQYVVKKYLVGLMIQAILVSAMVYFSLLFIGVKYSLLLAVITGIINILPYVGILTALLLISIITFATGTTFQIALVVVALVVIHVIDGNYIVPKIVGSKVKINSMFAMIAIIIGEMMWGIAGMFLAIPTLAISKIIFDRVLELAPWGFLIGEEDYTDEGFKEIINGQVIEPKEPEATIVPLD